MKRILIVNPFGIGDVLFSTPLIAALKGQDPGFTISYLANARTAPLIRNDPRIDRVLVYERDEFVAVYKKSPWQFLLKWRGLIDEIRSGKFDVAFDLSMGSPLGVALVLAGIGQRIGFNYKGRGRWLTHSIPLQGFEGRHVVEYNLDLLSLLSQSPGGGRGSHPAIVTTAPSLEFRVPGVYRMSLFMSPADEVWADKFIKDNNIKFPYIIGLYPGGGSSWGVGASVRRWAWENYAKLADKMVEKASSAIILMGDKSDVPLCEKVARQMSSPAFIAAGQTTLGQAAALMKRCRRVILNDGGAMHVAAACGVRTAVVFGPVDPYVYGPYPIQEHKIAVSGVACQPCYRNFRMSACTHQRCLRQLTVEEVFQTIKEWL